MDAAGGADFASTNHITIVHRRHPYVSHATANADAVAKEDCCLGPVLTHVANLRPPTFPLIYVVTSFWNFIRVAALYSGTPTTGGTGRTKRVRPQGEEREVAINNAAKLKVAGGIVKGRRLESPDVFLRPMMAKVRWNVGF